MKKTLVLLLLASLLTGCSSRESYHSKLIKGNWDLASRTLSDGTNEKLNDFEKKTNISFKSDNIFKSNIFSKMNNDLFLKNQKLKEAFNLENGSVEIIKTSKATYKLENNIIEIIQTFKDTKGQTIMSVRKVKIKFTNSSTFESSQIIQDTITKDLFKEVWRRN